MKVEINEQTGESLISGMGELHLEIIENRIKTEKKFGGFEQPAVLIFERLTCP